MQIQKLAVENFRGILKAETTLRSLTAFIGENNSCKSTFLKAIDAFFGSETKLKSTDYHQRTAEATISITITFGNLTPRDKESLSTDESSITITREFSQQSEKSGAYYAEARVNQAFSKCRAEAKATPKRALYDEIREEFGLEKVTSADQIEEKFAKWEAENPGKLVLERTGRLLGFTNVALGRIKEATSFHFIPAVQDASQTIDSERTSPIRSLISQIARDTIENRKEFADFKEQANARLRDLTSPGNIPSLKSISERLTELLSQYYAQSKLHASWNPLTEMPIAFPSALVEVEDNLFVASIDTVGHGLQRAALFAVLEFMARSSFESKNVDGQMAYEEAHSDIIIAIEEPEVYQHPSKQRLLYEALKNIAQDFNKQTGIRVQILYATHSHLFLQLQDAEAIRVCRRDPKQDGRPVQIVSTSLEECAKAAAAASKKGEPNVKLFTMGLHTFTPEIAEGFFSKACVLVEGVSDRVVLLAYYMQKDLNPLSHGVYIASTEGKTKMDKPIIVFEQFGVPCFYLFDNDSQLKASAQRTTYNRMLQRLGGVTEEDLVDLPSGVTSRFFALPGNLETYVRSKVEAVLYDQIIAELSNDFDVDARECLKSPAIASNLFKRLMENGATFAELDQVIEEVARLTGTND